jgi:hypothetical protein
MGCVNQTPPDYVNQMGKTQSNDLAERHGRGTAWELHGNGMVCVNPPLQACPVVCHNYNSLLSTPVCVHLAHSISDTGRKHPANRFHYQRSNSPRKTGCPETSVPMHGDSQLKLFNFLRADDRQIRHKNSVFYLTENTLRVYYNV